MDAALRRLEIRVPREDADRFDADAVPNERVAKGVAELVEGPDLHLLRLRDPRLEILKRPEDLLPRRRRAVRSDDEARVRELVSRRFDENVSKRRRDRDEALVARLRREHLARGERAPHVELVLFELHIADFERANLARSKTRVRLYPSGLPNCPRTLRICPGHLLTRVSRRDRMGG